MRRSIAGIGVAAIGVAVLGVAVLGSAAPLSAQATRPAASSASSVQGHLRTAADGAPLVGGWVTLTDESGRTLASTLTDSTGAFVLRTSTGGARRVRAEYPGYATVEVASGDPTRELELEAAQSVLGVPDGERKIEKHCALAPEDAERIAALWGEAHKAFRATVLAQEQGLYRYEIETWYKALDPRRLRATEEDRTPRPGFHATARVPSPPAEEMARNGYIVGGAPGESLSFYGPDAGTLLSDAFFGSHCLGFDDSGPEDGWIGLTFRPVDERRRDVEGTLWIDADTYEPERVDYRYTQLPWPVRTDKAGGTIEFRRLQDGPRIVHRWWMRMPRVELRSARITQWDPPRERYVLSGLVEEGGRVLRVQTRGGHVEELR